MYTQILQSFKIVFCDWIDRGKEDRNQLLLHKFIESHILTAVNKTIVTDKDANKILKFYVLQVALFSLKSIGISFV